MKDLNLDTTIPPRLVWRLIQWHGNYFWTGGQDRECQSREREIKVFVGIRAFFCPENKRSPKKKKSSPDLGGFLSQKWLRIQVSGEAKVAQGGPKYLQGGSCPPCPLHPAPMG